MDEFIARITTIDDDQSKSQSSYCDSIKRQKLLSFENKNEKVKKVTEDENISFGEILSCFEGKKLNVQYL